MSTPTAPIKLRIPIDARERLEKLRRGPHLSEAAVLREVIYAGLDVLEARIAGAACAATDQDQLVQVDVDPAACGTRTRVRWRSGDRSGICEATDLTAALADVGEAARVPGRRPTEFLNRGSFLGGAK